MINNSVRKNHLKIDRLIISSLIDLEPSMIELPVFGGKASAGFPSPADDYIEDKLTLDEILINHPAATYLVRVKGSSMIDDRIHDNDLLIVDRSIKPQDGKIAVVAIDGEITVKRLSLKNGRMFLIAGNSKYPPIELNENNNVVIWGVVKTIIHNV